MERVGGWGEVVSRPIGYSSNKRKVFSRFVLFRFFQLAPSGELGRPS